MPSRDSVVPNDHESKATVEPKKTQIHAMSQLNVTYTHLLMHAHHISLPEKSDWSWGFPSAVRPSPQEEPKNTRAHTPTQAEKHIEYGSHSAGVPWVAVGG